MRLFGFLKSKKIILKKKESEDYNKKEAKIHQGHSTEIMGQFQKELKAHDWFHAYSDSHSVYLKGHKHMEEIRGAIAWFNSNKNDVGTSLSVDAQAHWKNESPKEFKKQYPKNLKKGKTPSWITKILNKKPKPARGGRWHGGEAPLDFGSY